MSYFRMLNLFYRNRSQAVLLETPATPTTVPPYQRRQSYELASDYDVHFGAATLPTSCRVHGSRNVFPPPPDDLAPNENPLNDPRNERTPPPPSLLHHTVSVGNLGSATTGMQGSTQNNLSSIRKIHFCPEFLRAMDSVHYIADCTRRSEEENEVCS